VEAGMVAVLGGLMLSVAIARFSATE
jgi:hypothetical protein